MKMLIKLWFQSAVAAELVLAIISDSGCALSGYVSKKFYHCIA